jgi:carbamoylphosphate synthase large subunit
VLQEACCAYEELLVTPPTGLSLQAQEAIREYADALLYHLDLRNCFCHVEMRYDSRGRPSVIEVNPRVGRMRVVDSLETLAHVNFYDTFGRGNHLSR